MSYYVMVYHVLLRYAMLCYGALVGYMRFGVGLVISEVSETILILKS